MIKVKQLKITSVLFVVCTIALSLAPAAYAANNARWCNYLPGNPSGPGDFCTDYATLQDAVDAAKADGNPGTIGILNNATVSENVVMDGLKGILMDNGGTIDGTLTISKSSVISIISLTVTGGITVTDQKGALEITHCICAIDIEGGWFGKPFSVPGLSIGEGIFMEEDSGDIQISDVTVTGSQVSGAILEQLTPGSDVTISNSSFTKNGEMGLFVGTEDATIILRNVTAAHNKTEGANLYTTGTGSVIVETTTSKRNHFDNNVNHGLEIQTGSGSIFIFDTTATGNTLDGLRATSDSGAVVVSTSNSTGNFFDKNKRNGLLVQTVGLISLADINARSNTASGVLLTDTGAPSSTISVNAYHSKRNDFSRNGLDGLTISSDGDVKLTDIYAVRNKQNGVNVTATGGGFTLSSDKSKINTFDHNTFSGLNVVSDFGQTLADFAARHNGMYGVNLHNAVSGGIIVDVGQSKQNVANNNTGMGLVAFSSGAIAISSTTANLDASGFSLSSSSGPATLTCSTANKNLSYGIVASLGSWELYLNSFSAAGNGVMDTNLLSGTGPIVSTVSCP